jgi:predicted flap endonuclease-1-like 5' DNA nuclease
MSTSAQTSKATLQIIAIGAATGAVAGAGAVAIYALLLGKGLTAAGLAKAGVGLSSAASAPASSPPALSRLLDLLLPGTIGAAGGGAAGAGLAQRQVKRALAPLRAQVSGLARQVMQVVGEADAQATSEDSAASKRGKTRVVAPAGIDRAVGRGLGFRELQRVHGIGPRFAQLLVAGGIDSLAQLAAADADAVRALLQGSSAAPTAQPEQWIAEARALTAEAGGDL